MEKETETKMPKAEIKKEILDLSEKFSKTVVNLAAWATIAETKDSWKELSDSYLELAEVSRNIAALAYAMKSDD